MAAHRFFLESVLDAPVVGAAVALPISDADRHHLVSVLRVRAGENVEVVEPAGAGAWLARVEEAGAESVTATLLERLAAPAAEPRVTLVQGVAKGEKMDAIVRQAVEIGAAEIMPALTARTVVRLDERKRADRGERWRRIAKAAAEQSHRSHVPHVNDPAPLGDLLGVLAGYDAVLVLWEEEHATGLRSALAPFVGRPDARIALVVGPEGGLDAAEVALLAEAGAVPVTLGDTILRTETAALVALSLVAWSLGGLGADRE